VGREKYHEINILFNLGDYKMALKGDRVEHLTDISFFKADAVIERGLIVAHLTGGSGAAMDDSLAQVDTVSSTGDLAAGLILNDVVNLDLTRQQYNAHKDEVQLGGKVTLLRRGTVVTDQISGTPVIGEKVHFDATGKLTTASDPAGKSMAVGRWLGIKDKDGYAKVEINIV
jgi:hypothetical protein|tara:strand:- start:4217 stop:4732 length:516 start_codon:yes stop_codon:yes gene_type:complete